MSAILVLRHSLVYGAVPSLLLGLLIAGSIRLNAEIWLADYPPDIKAKFGPMSARARPQRALVAIPFFLILFGTVILSLARLAQAGGGLTFPLAFANLFIMMLVFNLVDLLIIDWLLGIVVRPRFIVLPGTEGLKGYRDYGFHFRAFLKGLAGSLAGSALVAAVALGVQTVLE